jgi:hypothetical protein
MDDEAETYKLWRIRKTVMQVVFVWNFHAFERFLYFSVFISVACP